MYVPLISVAPLDQVSSFFIPPSLIRNHPQARTVSMDKVTQRQHALDLPEVLFRVALYLDAKDVITCSVVSRAFHTFFAPFVWGSIHMGLHPSQQKAVCYEDPFARFISFDTKASEDQEQCQPSQEEKLLKVLQRIAPWIRSLSIHEHQSPCQLMLGEHFTTLESLSIVGPPFNNEFDWTYWTSCMALVKQNSAHLRSLSLTNWRKQHHRFSMPTWNPIAECAQHKSLRSLSIKAGYINREHMASFWQVCQHLESLKLEYIYVTLSPPRVSRKDRTGTTAKSGINLGYPITNRTLPPTGTEEHFWAVTAPTVRLPKLKKLTLNRLYNTGSLHQLHWFIAICPMLQTLEWTIPREALFPVKEFTHYLAAKTWPELDSITIKEHQNHVSDREYADIIAIVQAQRPLKILDLKFRYLESGKFDLMRQSLFKTLTKIELDWAADGSSEDPSDPPAPGVSKWVQEVLESCPSLEYISARNITAQDILDGNPWVCLGLKEFQVMINMEFHGREPERGPKRLEYSEAEENRCRAVYGQLGRLEYLRVLNMQCRFWRTYAMRVSLPLELRLGLGELYKLTNMKEIGFHDSQDMRMADLEWMLQHWPRLVTLHGGRLSWKRSKSFGNTFVRDSLLATRLDAAKVQHPRRWIHDDSSLRSYMRTNDITEVYDSESESESECEEDEGANSHMQEEQTQLP
ncbi:MAG: hypothetical protein J3Q66DRAFT_425291 [Benniella sp.]|nr:MAG: hypothetical protein J3Q66DRAFT_425291 [Benniella sp.]